MTAISVFERGPAVQRPAVVRGRRSQSSGVSPRSRSATGSATSRTRRRAASVPPADAGVGRRAGEPDDGARLRVALAQLAEQDPLINVRQDDTRQELSVSLYGEVQKEVIQATLADEFGLDVTFRETTPIYIERPVGTGEAVELLHAESNPFLATIGLRIEPAPDGSGIEFRLRRRSRCVPLYVYKTLEQLLGAHGPVRPRGAAARASSAGRSPTAS